MCVNQNGVSTWYRKSNVTHVRRSDTPIFLSYVRDFFFSTRNTRRPIRFCAEEKHECFIASLARQNSVQCIANLSHFLCITFSKRRREPNGRRYFPNNRQHLAGRLFFVSPRDAGVAQHEAHGRGGGGSGARRCEFNYFRSETSFSLLYGNLTYRKRVGDRDECEKRETRKRGTMCRCTVLRQCVAMNFLPPAPKFDRTSDPESAERKRVVRRTRRSFWRSQVGGSSLRAVVSLWLFLIPRARALFLLERIMISVK